MCSDRFFRAQVGVSLMPKLNRRQYLPFWERCGGFEGFFLESEEGFRGLCREFGIVAESLARREAFEQAGREMEEIERHGIRLLTAVEEGYPPLLEECGDAPLVLFYKGKLPDFKAHKFLAIVGTRKASVLYQERVGQVVAELREMGHQPVIVSGLAYGIDAAAHRASLKEGLTTIAVLGHGLNMVYPATHKGMAQKIVETGGALLSEFPCTASVQPSNFLQRNRIVAGLCQATLVAESAVKGGAMSTARIALSYNREVMAFPGRPNDVYSAGCNLLIKENIAALVENGADVARVLGYPPKKNAPKQTSLNLFETHEGEKSLLGLLQEQGSLHIDELCQRTGIGSGELAALLLQLELEGKVISLPGQIYALR